MKKDNFSDYDIKSDEIRTYLKLAHAARVDRLRFYLRDTNKDVDDYEIATSVYGDWEKDWEEKPIDEIVEMLRIYDSRIEPMSSQEYEIWAENTISFLLSWFYGDISYIKYRVCAH